METPSQNNDFGDNHRFWTGTKRLNEKEFIDENGLVTENPFCRTTNTYYGNTTLRDYRNCQVILNSVKNLNIVT